MSSGGNRWLQFSNNGGRGRSRDQIILISFFKFFKFRLLYHISSLVDVFNHSFWKLYIKTINDLDPGLNLPEFSKLRVHIKDNNKSLHGKFHGFLFPFSSKFPDLNFAQYVLHIFSCYETRT